MLDDLSKGLKNLRDLGKDAAASRDARQRARAQPGPSLHVPAELMGKEVTARCAACQRTIRNKVEVLAARLASGRARCEVCGGKLELPPEVHAVLERSSQEHAREAEARLAVQGLTCPVCVRGVSGARAGAVVKCGFCAVAFLVTAEGRTAPPPADVPPASPRELEPHLRLLAARERRAADLLGRRAARGEVSLAEAVTLAARFDALAAWSRAPQAEHLPLPPEEVPAVVVNVIFPGQMFLIAPQDLSEGGTLRVSVQQQGTQVSRARVLTNVLSLATLAAGGGGLFFLDLDAGPGKRRDWALGLTPRGSGTDLTVELETDGKPSRCPAKMLAAWTERVTGLGPPLRAYLLRSALFGPWAQGGPLFMVTSEAATARLRELGAEAPGALEALGFASP